MPEYWFKYGVTEVSLEVPEDIRHRRLEVGRRLPGEEFWKSIGEFVDDLVRDLGSGKVAIAYDHSGDGNLVLILRHVVERLGEEVEDKVSLLTSNWRLDPAAGRDHLAKMLRELGIRVKASPVEGAEKTSRDGLTLARDLAEASARIIIASSEPHGLLGRASIREALVLGGFVEVDLESGVLEEVDRVWDDVSSKIPLHAITIVDGEVYLGDAREVDGKVSEQRFEAPVEDFDVVVAGCGGYPRDAALQYVIHVLGLLRDAVVDEGLIALVAECGNGVGSSRFLEMLIHGFGRGLESELIRLAREIVDERRVAFASTLPKTILKNLLGVKGFDTPQELLGHAVRVYGKEARILLLEEPVLKPVRKQ